MLDVFHISPAQFETFLLVWLRTSTMLYVFPVFQSSQIPTLVRIGLGMLVSFVIVHTVPSCQKTWLSVKDATSPGYKSAVA